MISITEVFDNKTLTKSKFDIIDTNNKLYSSVNIIKVFNDSIQINNNNNVILINSNHIVSIELVKEPKKSVSNAPIYSV